MAIVKGKDLMLFKKSGASYTALGAATSHTLSVTAEMQETSNKDTGKWGTSQPGRYSWTMSTENMFIKTDFDALLEAQIEGEPLTVLFEVASNANSDTGKPAGGWTPAAGGWKGNVYISQIDANAPNEGPATYTVSFTGVGPLIKNTAVNP